MDERVTRNMKVLASLIGFLLAAALAVFAVFKLIMFLLRSAIDFLSQFPPTFLIVVAVSVIISLISGISAGKKKGTWRGIFTFIGAMIICGVVAFIGTCIVVLVKELSKNLIELTIFIAFILALAEPTEKVLLIFFE